MTDVSNDKEVPSKSRNVVVIVLIAVIIFICYGIVNLLIIKGFIGKLPQDSFNIDNIVSQP